MTLAVLVGLLIWHWQLRVILRETLFGGDDSL